MQLRGSEPTAVKAAEQTKSMKVRRNSFDGIVDKPKSETTETKSVEQKQKKAPKSVNGIDNLTLAISSIKLDSNTDSSADDKQKIKPTVTVKVVKKEDVNNKNKKEVKSKDDGEKETEVVDLENVTESYVASMRELLSSFDKSLQLDDDKTPTKNSKPAVTSPTSPIKKDSALPLPRFLLTGGSASPASPTSSTKATASSKKATAEPAKVEEKKSRPSSSTTPIVDDKEAGNSTPTRKVRPKSTPGPSDDNHIVRSSKSALPRRRGVPGDYDGSFAVQTGYNDFSGNLIPDATLDSLLGLSTQPDYMAKQAGATSMDFYGFPDLNSTLNMGFTGMGQDNSAAVYNTGEQGFTAESTPELVDCGEPGLGVYSSPAGPVTPPAGTPYSSQNLLASPYTPPDLNQPTPDNSMTFNGTWSAPSSNIGSPENYMSPQMTTFNRLHPQTVHEMKRIILLPLSQEPDLIQFTPLIGAASQRLDEGHICSLRDLEKFLLYKSQEMAPNAHSFLSFCERFLSRCQQSIPYIENAGGELTRPSDTPYYDGYFLDVMDQHRQAMASETASSQAPQMTILRRDPSSSISSSGSVPTKKSVPVISRISKNGGMGHTATTHANINSKVHDQILAALLDQSSGDVKLPEEFYQSHIPTQNQLPLSPVSEDDKDDGFHQDNSAMAPNQVGRRRRMTVQKPLGGHVCMHRDEESGIICGKKYNRPCDLKKHGKTHSRPHKCSEPTCLYHEKGFPTEKERDRHETDRHSDSPQMWHCEFPPCPYKSKRESNCKQHMEKQHDYVYERSKHNPRNPNGNADSAKKKAAATAAAVAVANNVHTLGSSVPIVKSSVVPSTHKSNGPSIFEGGISTPPSDVYTNLFSNVPSSMPYMTPSPEASHSFRSNSIGAAKPEPDVTGGDNWAQYSGWQPVMGNGMLGYGMTATE